MTACCATTNSRAQAAAPMRTLASSVLRIVLANLGIVARMLLENRSCEEQRLVQNR
jgi:hypothetical protein